jgi:hypothetical protein
MTVVPGVVWHYLYYFQKCGYFHQKNCFQRYVLLKEIKNMTNIWEHIIFQNGIIKIINYWTNMCWSGQGIMIFTKSKNGPTLDIRTSIEFKDYDQKSIALFQKRKFLFYPIHSTPIPYP